MVIYNEEIPKVGYQSSVVTDHHINIWLVENSVVP